MPSRDLLLRALFFFVAAIASPGSLAATSSVTASKDCSTSPCTVVEATFTLLVAQTIQWQATYTGGPTQGHSFYLSTVASNMADIALTTSGQLSGSYFLQPGTYFISIRVALMGPGFYTITYNPSSTGDPHITTIDGSRYDFQGAGEFVLLRHSQGLEIQTRQAPIATSFNPGADPHDGLAVCVSLNTAVAARVGKHRVTYEPNLNGVPDPTGLQLRVDGRLTALGPDGLDLGSSGRIARTSAPGGIEVDFPDQTVLFATPGWWADQGKWYLNIDVVPGQPAAGIAGTVAPRSWLPALSDGSSLGAMPTSLRDRYVDLYQKFADAWRVTKEASLFDYAPGTSTDAFTMHDWPPEHPPCPIPGVTPVEPTSQHVAEQACQSVIGEHARCVFDVMVTGNPGFATTYAFSQGLQPHRETKWWNMRPVLILIGLLLVALILLLMCASRRRT